MAAISGWFRRRRASCLLRRALLLGAGGEPCRVAAVAHACAPDHELMETYQLRLPGPAPARVMDWTLLLLVAWICQS